MVYYNHIQDNNNELRLSNRERFETIDLNYQRELDREKENVRAKQANRAGNADRFQNITIPVIMPQVEAAVTYQTSVFLTGEPIFGAVASPEFIDEALQLETTISEQAVNGAWTKELILFFRDGFKYNLAAVLVDWVEEKTAILETDVAYSTKEAKPVSTIWAGNVVKRMDMYNTFADHKVLPTEVPTKGEFAGYTEFVSRMELKRLIAEMPNHIIGNVRTAFETSSLMSTSATINGKHFYVPMINPEYYNHRREQGGTNWLAYVGLEAERRGINYKSDYELTTIFVRILPSEHGINTSAANTPQIFKLKIVNHQTIIDCERQTNAHNLIPMLFSQPAEDGLGYQTKSLATNGLPFQALSSALMNSVVHSKRRALTDRVIYNPSLIDAAHINSDNPSAKIPIKPGAYGKSLSEAVYQFPFRDDQAGTSMSQIQAILGLANSLNGQNQASQGQFVKGNKTLHEFESVMQNANGRDQLVSILLEAQVFTPMKRILKTNILQYQGGTTIYNRDAKKLVEVDPVKLRKAIMEFRISDGLIPSSKIINAESFAMALQTIGSTPSIAAGYNLAPMVSYMLKGQGADVSPFEKSPEQMAYEQALSAWQNVMNFYAEKDKTVPAESAVQPKPEDFGYNPKPAAPIEE